MATINESNLLERMGGEAAVRQWVEIFYTAVKADAILAPMFPEDLSASKEKQYAFFVQMLGGPPLYNERYGNPFLRYRHRKVKIGVPERDAWMKHVMDALRQVTPDTGLVDSLEQHLGRVADHMINHHPDKKDARYFN